VACGRAAWTRRAAALFGEQMVGARSVEASVEGGWAIEQSWRGGRARRAGASERSGGGLAMGSCAGGERGVGRASGGSCVARGAAGPGALRMVSRWCAGAGGLGLAALFERRRGIERSGGALRAGGRAGRRLPPREGGAAVDRVGVWWCSELALGDLVVERGERVLRGEEEDGGRSDF
jgi:hypothetical protein